ITEGLSGTDTIHAALDEAGIGRGERDGAVVTADEDGTPIVTITRITVEEKEKTETVEFESETRTNSEKYKDEKQVVQEGKNGERTIVTKVTKVDGEVTDKEEVSNKVTTEPVTQITEVGTKTRPAPEPAENSDSGDSGGEIGGGKAPSSGGWAALAQRESRGNPGAGSATGTYHGLYQFSVATW